MRKILLVIILLFAVIVFFTDKSYSDSWLEPRVTNKFPGANVHETPSIHSKLVGVKRGAVRWTGETDGAYIEIVYIDRQGYFKKGWVFAEYYIEFPEEDYVEYPSVIGHITTVDYAYLREGPSILSDIRGYHSCKGEIIPLVGKKEFWYKTVWDVWVYEELVKPIKPIFLKLPD